MIWLGVAAVASGLGALILRGRWHHRREVVAVAATLALGLSGTAIAVRDAPAQPARLGGDVGYAAEAYSTARPLLLAATGDTAAWLSYAEALTRSGNTLAAIRGLERGLADDPRNPDLWIGLGEALARHGGDDVGPAARTAFDRAAELAPASPAPPYFLGLALVREGRAEAALDVWSTILVPPGAPWAAPFTAQVEAARHMVR